MVDRQDVRAARNQARTMIVSHAIAYVVGALILGIAIGALMF